MFNPLKLLKLLKPCRHDWLKLSGTMSYEQWNHYTLRGRKANMAIKFCKKCRKEVKLR